MNVFLSELEEKDIISVKTGLNYGHIVDVKIASDGKIVSFLVANKKILTRVFKNEQVEFAYTDIEKIGEDVILINI